MTKKTWIVIGAALAAVAAAAGCAALTGSKQETYRSIMVYQVNGSAEITRERVGGMEAYENLMLLSGDVVEVGNESNMRLKLDDDKYLLAEQDTLMNIKADGDGDNAKTYIDLQRGSVTSEIQNKLEKGASYEVNTPNSIMAVRGTIFRVALEQAEDGELETKLSVFDGTVGVKQVLPDGTVLDTEIAVEAGKELKINENQLFDAQANTVEDIDYESLPPVMKEYLEELAQKGGELPENVMQGIQNMQNAQDAQEQNEQNEQKANENTALDTVQGEQDIEQKNEEKDAPEEPDAPEQPDAPKKPKKEEQKTTEAQTQQIKPEEQETKEKDKEEEKAKENETKPKKEDVQQSPEAGDENKPSGGGGAKTQYYTVTFKYNGSVFGTQTVKKGEKAAEPKLSPAQKGGWDYDFSKKVNKNTVVDWKEK